MSFSLVQDAIVIRIEVGGIVNTVAICVSQRVAVGCGRKRRALDGAGLLLKDPVAGRTCDVFGCRDIGAGQAGEQVLGFNAGLIGCEIAAINQNIGVV
jgi:hypothetical protein